MSIVSCYMPELSGYLVIPGNSLTLKLTKSSDFSVLNGAGDTLEENGTSGWFSAAVEEPWAERLGAAVVDQNGLIPRSGILNVGSTIIADGYAEGTATGSSPEVMLVSGFTPEGRAQLSAALSAAYDDGTLDLPTCIPLVSGSDWRIDFISIGQLTGRTNLIFAVKNRSNDTDSASLILVDTTTGLKFVNGSAYGTPANASIIVTDETAGTGYVLVKSAATINLPCGQKYAGLKLVKASGDIRVTEPWRPCVTILDGIVKANS